MWNPDSYLKKLTRHNDLRSSFKEGDNWKDWRFQLQHRFIERLGGFPEESAQLEVELLERKEEEGFIRERVSITTFDGLRMPMYVLYPLRPSADGQPYPAIVACHGHGYGSREIVGLEPDGTSRAGAPGIHKDFAVELVRRGFVVAAPELLGFGDRRLADEAGGKPHDNSCYRIAVHLLMVGQTIAGHRIYETMRAVDYLQSRAEISSDKIGCMGLSGGGLVAAFASALDERIKQVVVSGYTSTFADSILARRHCLDNYIPGILLEAELPDLIGLIAPRPLLIESGDRDHLFPQEAARKAYSRLYSIYKAAGAEQQLEHDFFSGGHEISGTKSFSWFNSLKR